MQRLAGPGAPSDGSWPRLGVTADIHVGNHRRFGGKLEAGLNRRCREHVETFQRAAFRARAAKCDVHFVAGDVFDHEKPKPQEEAAVQNVCRILPTGIVVGNHDQNSGAPGDHACSPLRPVATVIEEPTIFEYAHGEFEVWVVPFLSLGKSASEWLPGVLGKLSKLERDEAVEVIHRVLILHMGVADKDTPPWLTRGHNWIDVGVLNLLAKEHAIDVVLAGDWHEHKRYDLDMTIVQIGALVPTGFDNPGVIDYGSLILVEVDGDALKVEREIISGPRFVQAKSVDEAVLPDDDSTVYLEITARSLDVGAEATKLAALKKAGVFADGEVKTNKEEVELEARDAARSARSAETLDEAVVNFIERMPLPDGVDRSNVVARTQRFLG
jgi:DNA repair exonuclease SbcCD nuclease subunit